MFDMYGANAHLRKESVSKWRAGIREEGEKNRFSNFLFGVEAQTKPTSPDY